MRISRGSGDTSALAGRGVITNEEECVGSYFVDAMCGDLDHGGGLEMEE